MGFAFCAREGDTRGSGGGGWGWDGFLLAEGDGAIGDFRGAGCCCVGVRLEGSGVDVGCGQDSV
jgi:hypothetical protein